MSGQVRGLPRNSGFIKRKPMQGGGFRKPPTVPKWTPQRTALPAVKPPAAPPAPAAPAVPAVSTPRIAAPRPPATTPNPQDSRYTDALALLARQRDDAYTDLDTAGQRDDSALAQAIKQLAEQRTQTLDGTTRNANRQGLFYSGILGQRMDDVNKGYDTTLNEQQGAYRQRQADRATARKRVGDDYTDRERQAIQDAIDRQIQRDLDAGLGQPDPEPDTPAAPAVQDLATATVAAKPAARRPTAAQRQGQAKRAADARARAQAQAAKAKSNSKRRSRR